MALIFSGLIGIVVGIVIEKFKWRVVLFKRRINFFPVGTSTESETWGKIEVTHDGRITKHLNLVTLEIENDSSKNFTNMFLDVWVEENNQILSFVAHYSEGKAIELDKEYQKFYESVVKSLTEDEEKRKISPTHIKDLQLAKNISYAQMNKKFSIPVFNKKTLLKFNFLVENYIGEQPKIYAVILHEGMKLVDAKDKETENEDLAIGLFRWGLIVFAIGCFALLRNYNNNYPLIWALVLGLFYYPIGLLIFILIRFLKRLIN